MTKTTAPKWNALIQHLPQDSGVYTVWCGPQLLYVGSSTNLRKRLGCHPYRRHFMKHKADQQRSYAAGRSMAHHVLNKRHNRTTALTARIS